MVKDDKRRFAMAIGALAVSFDKEPSDALLRGYWLGLRDLEIGDVERACERALARSQFFPRPVEIRKLAGEIGADSRAVIAWRAVVKAIGEHGAYASVDFDDPLINATIRNLGGWEKLCVTEADEFAKWTRKDFERVYMALHDAPLVGEAVRYLPGIAERRNGADGHETEAPRSVAVGLPLTRNTLGAAKRDALPSRTAQLVGKVLEGDSAVVVGEPSYDRGMGLKC